MATSLARIVDRHFADRAVGEAPGTQTRRVGTAAARWVRLSGEPEARVRAWISDVTAAGRYCVLPASVVRSWPAYRMRSTRSPLIANITVLTRTPMRDLAFADAELAPLLASSAALLAAGTLGYVGARIDVTYVAWDRRRALPAARDVRLDAAHVNGGVTMGPAMMVFRREDACKVAVHELLHALGTDAAIRKRGTMLSEAFTETLACWLHSRWWLARHGIQPGSREETAVERRLARHVEVAAIRVSHHCAQGADKVWREGTNAYAYYVCKAAIWRRLPAFLAGAPTWSLGDVAGFERFLASALADRDFRDALGQPPRAGRSLRMTYLD
jgi:hypothetical protein